MKVTNNSKALQGVNTKSGPVYIAPGQTKDVELTEEGAKQAKRLKFLSLGAKAAKEPEQKPATGYTVVDKSRGWFVVTKDGQEVTKSLREDDVKGFDAMSDDDKAAFVDLHKAD